MDAIIPFAAAVMTAAALTPLCIKLARWWDVLDYPRGRLKTHRAPVPYLGGLAMYVGFTTSILAMVAWTEHPLKEMQAVLIGAGLLFLLGLLDDIHPLNIPLKFAWQSAVALGVIFWGDLSVHVARAEWINVCISTIWIVGMTNAMNIIDIMDGLAGGVAVLTAATFTWLAAQEGMTEVAWTGAAFSGSALGVLWYNRPPARIYYGDAGALMMGFTLASLAIAARYTTHHLAGFAAPLLILAVPLFDTAFVMWQRYRQGRPVTFGSADHFPLRLERRGWSRPRVVGVILTATAALCLFVVVSNGWPPLPAGLGYALAGLALAAFAWWLHHYAP